MEPIKKTTNYALFKKHENNRALHQGNLKKIIASIQVQNMLRFRPILVNQNMEVIDGQHRLEAAKRLGLEIFYQINKESTHEDIPLLNSNQRRWALQEYVDYHVSLGNSELKILSGFCKEHQCTVSDITYICDKRRETLLALIKKGTLETKQLDLENIREILWKTHTVISLIKKYIIRKEPFLNSARLKRAIMSLLTNKQVCFETLLEKVKYKCSSVKACADVAAYSIMFRDIYNFRNPNPIE